MKSCVTFLATYAWVLFIAGCSPSLDEAKLVLQQRIASESQEHIRVVSFTKTDEQKFETGGVQGRRISYAAEVEFDDDGLWSRGVGNEALAFEFSTNLPPKHAGGVALAMMDLGGVRHMFKGECIKIVGVMTGTKSESGWRYELKENHIAD